MTSISMAFNHAFIIRDEFEQVSNPNKELFVTPTNSMATGGKTEFRRSVF